jgi:hypothetical protein
LLLLVVLCMFYQVSLVLVHGVMAFCYLFSRSGALHQMCCLVVIIVVILFKKKKKKNSTLSDSLVVVMMGALHMVSKQVQPATWEHYIFH